MGGERPSPSTTVPQSICSHSTVLVRNLCGRPASRAAENDGESPRRPACLVYLGGLDSSFLTGVFASIPVQIFVHILISRRPSSIHLQSISSVSSFPPRTPLSFPLSSCAHLPLIHLLGRPFLLALSSLVVFTGRTAAEHRQKSLVETAESRQKFSSKHAPLFRPSAAKGAYRHPHHRQANASASPREGARAPREQRGGCVPAAVFSGFL